MKREEKHITRNMFSDMAPGRGLQKILGPVKRAVKQDVA